MNFFVDNLPYILAGISVGGQYALIAIGYTMVYGILRLINFAHGDMFMVAGLVMVYLAASMPIYIAIPVVLYLPWFWAAPSRWWHTDPFGAHRECL